MNAANSPEELEDLVARYARAGDLDAWLSLYEPSATCLNGDGDLVRGADALRENLAPFAALKPEFVMKIKIVGAGDIALIHNQWEDAAQSMSGYAIEVARRQPDGTWRFVIDDLFTIDNRLRAITP